MHESTYNVNDQGKVKVSKRYYSIPISFSKDVSSNDIYYYLSFFFAILTLYCLKRKLDIIQKYGEVISKNIFLIVTLILIIFEIVYKYAFLISGNLDFVGYKDLLIPENMAVRMNMLLYFENIKILKAFELFLISIHFGFVLFPHNLEVYLIFSKPAFQRLFIAFLIFITSYSLIIYQFLGYFVFDYNNIFNTIINLFIKCLNFNLSNLTVINESKSINKVSFYVHFGAFILKHMILQFSLSITLFYYEKIFKKFDRITAEMQIKDEQK